MPIALSAALPALRDDSLEVARRQPPQNIPAEKALLGAIFVNNRAFERVSEFLRPEHFAIEQHGRIYAAAGLLIERGQIADPVTLRRYFEQEQTLAEIGGPAYLMELAESATTVINAGEYGRLIHDLHLKRELIDIGENMVNDAFSGEVDETATGQIEKSEQRLYDLATTGEYDRGFETFARSLEKAIEMAERAHKREGKIAGITTGFRDIDLLLGGLHPSDLVILAGRPAMGKTALATNIAFNAASTYVRSKGAEGAVVGFFSLEMSSEQLAARVLSEATNISSDAMRKGQLSNEEFDRLAAAVPEINRLPMFIDDTPGLTVSALRTRARRLKRQHNLGLIVIDYLQLISGGAAARPDNRVQEVSEITRGLKILAKELNVPVLALSQLSRQVESRDDKKPQLADLRESGSIEQDADVVMFIFREEYYVNLRKPAQRDEEDSSKFAERHLKWEERMERVRNLAEIIVAKQRHGPVGTVELMFQGRFTRFGDLDREHSPEA
jgi:replicative DNA helicase